MTRSDTASTIIEPIDGGITAPAGFRAAGVACGVKARGLDFALIVATDTPRRGPDLPAAAGVFTTNLAIAAPVMVSREHLQRSGGRAAAIVINSGCANACTGAEGVDATRETAREAARLLGVASEHVLVASTGVIGVALDVQKIKRGLGIALAALDSGHHLDAAQAIMTTDVAPKEAAVVLHTGRGDVRVGGMAKGAGMIEPHMATMLGFLTTDASIDPALLHRALQLAVRDSFNAITVDGDASTNDTVFVLANGASGIHIDETTFDSFVDGLRDVSGRLAREIVRGGEGATKLVTVKVSGAASADDADRAARTIANSLLVKTAIHGGDPNWGRLVAAAGRAGVAFDVDRAVVRIGPTVLFEHGRPFDDRAPDAAKYLQGSELTIEVDLGTGGPHARTIWTCDLSAEYVRINAEYRT